MDIPGSNVHDLGSKHPTLAGNLHIKATLDRLLADGSSAEDGRRLELDDAAAALVAAAALSARARSFSWEVPRLRVATYRFFVLTTLCMLCCACQ